MAEPAANERPTGADEHLHGEAGANGPSSTPQPFPPTMTTAFQVVNATPLAGNSSPATNADSRPTPLKDGPVVQKAPQAAQTSSEASQAPNASLQADGLDGTMTDTAATYGTRSRNRAGNPRPNYAEDQEMEIDSSTATAKRKHAQDPSQLPTDAKRAQEFSRLGGGNSNVNGSPSADTFRPKESTPTVSKKRKAGGAPAISTQTPPVSNSPMPTATRKSGAFSVMARETNIMTFTKHKSCLNKKGELVADDGTKLNVDGKSGPLIWDSYLEVEAYPALADFAAVLRA